jgi:3-hydroxyisobutyrate dehydrogenase-like beta-hydroxyacid dehydrogenase
MPTVSFIGLGAMGYPMAARIASQCPDWALTTYDLSDTVRERAQALGAVAATVEEALHGANVVVSMLPADRHVAEVARTVATHARPGAIYVDLSTIHPATIGDIRGLLEPAIHVVSGSCMKAVAAAETGDLTIFVDGDPAAREQIAPLLAAMASTVVAIEHAGGAKTLKIVNNMVVAGLNLVIADAAVIGARGNLPREELAEEIRAAGHGGWAFENQFVRHTLTGRLGAGLFSVRYMAKDVALAARLADDCGQPRFLCGLLAAAYRGAEALGYGDRYHPVVIRWLEAGAAARPDVAPVAGLGPLLADCVGAAEQLVTAHGLDVAAATGMSRGAAAAALALASASSASMQLAAADPDWAPQLDQVSKAVTAVGRVMAELEVPGLTIEASHDELHRRRPQ